MKADSQRNIYISAWITAVMLFLILVSGFFLIINIYYDNLEKDDRLDLYEQQFIFVNELEFLISSNTNLLRGYRAFIRHDPGIGYQESSDYLDFLLEDRMYLIRNIGVLKDTTIIWNYPRTGNEAAIGIDLTEVREQREDVLHVKETLETVFIGPVSLVQGGSGFIIRIPLVVQDEYWGQISVVLDAERYFNIIGEMAASYEFNYVVFRSERENSREIITGDIDILQQDPVLTDFNVLNSKLRVGIVPENGWPAYTRQYILSLAVAGAVSFLLSFLIFMLIATRKELRVMAIHDSLTGLHNRTFFNNYIKILKAKSDRSSGRAAFLLLDINKFKHFNDTYGHKVGDRVLISIGERFERVLRHSETAFRIGGDEFVICIPEAGSTEEVLKLVERLKRELSFTVSADEIIIPVSVSIGYALYPDDGSSIDAVLEKADAGMYRDKKRSE